MSAQPQYRYTPEEYLALERSATEKHEFLNGELLTMAGASFEHTIISSNIVAALKAMLRRRGCSIHSSDLRTQTSSGLYTYPDIVIVCGKPEFHDDVFDTVINPVIIVEILSDSTAVYDRTKKFDHYRTIPSLREYVLVEQNTPRIELYRRIQDEYIPLERILWAFRAMTHLGETLMLESVDCSVSLGEIYEGIEFIDNEKN